MIILLVVKVTDEESRTVAFHHACEVARAPWASPGAEGAPSRWRSRAGQKD